LLWPALLVVSQITDTAAQTLPVLGYVAAKNANPKRLEVFKQGPDARQDRHVMSQALRLCVRNPASSVASLLSSSVAQLRRTAFGCRRRPRVALAVRPSVQQPHPTLLDSPPSRTRLTEELDVAWAMRRRSVAAEHAAVAGFGFLPFTAITEPCMVAIC
jgi:hypothetical protein